MGWVAWAVWRAGRRAGLRPRSILARSAQKEGDLLHGVPLQLVVVETLDGELRIVVPEFGGVEKGDRGAHIEGRAGIVDVRGDDLVEPYRIEDPNRGRIVARIEDNGVVFDVGSQNDPPVTTDLPCEGELETTSRPPRAKDPTTFMALPGP